MLSFYPWPDTEQVSAPCVRYIPLIDRIVSFSYIDTLYA